MYKIIRAILDKSNKAMVDIGVATAMLRNGLTEEDAAVYTNALNVLQKYYVAITTFNRDGKYGLIMELCNLIEDNNAEGISNFLDEQADYIQASLEAASKE